MMVKGILFFITLNTDLVLLFVLFHIAAFAPAGSGLGSQICYPPGL